MVLDEPLFNVFFAGWLMMHMEARIASACSYHRNAARSSIIGMSMVSHRRLDYSAWIVVLNINIVNGLCVESSSFVEEDANIEEA